MENLERANWLDLENAQEFDWSATVYLNNEKVSSKKIIRSTYFNAYSTAKGWSEKKFGAESDFSLHQISGSGYMT